MERELIFTGIGGQGVQIATRALANAAAARGLRVMMFGSFAGSVRGGRSETTLVVSGQEIESPPIVPSCWCAVALHPEYADPVLTKVRDGGIVIVNSSLMERDGATGVPMTQIAEELGNVGLVGMVALGATVAATGLVPLEAAVEAMRAEIPPYRAQRIPSNEAAIAKGAAAI